MFGTEIIEVGIGLAFAYFVISIICSGIVEAGVKITKLRAKHLKMALGELLDDRHFNGFVKELYDHHLVTSALQDKLGDPTSIGSRKFALAVLDILGKNEDLTQAQQFKVIEERIKTIKSDRVRKRMLDMLRSSANRFDKMQSAIEDWFNEAMDDVSEWYRIRMRNRVFIVSMVVVTIMNADTVRMAKMLWNDDELRTATVSAASTYVEQYEQQQAQQGTSATHVITSDSTGALDTTLVASGWGTKRDSMLLDSLGQDLRKIYTNINAAKVLPIGWNDDPLPGKPGSTGTANPIGWWLLKIAGLVLTIGAVSLGSTYWYRQLKGLLSLMPKRGGQGTSSEQGGGGGSSNTPAQPDPLNPPVDFSSDEPVPPPAAQPVSEQINGSGTDVPPADPPADENKQ